MLAIAVAAAVGTALCFALGLLAVHWIDPLARRAIEHCYPSRSWRFACGAASLYWLGFIVFGLFLIAFIELETSWFSTPAGAIFGATIVIGALVGLSVDALRRWRRHTWTRVHESLDRLLPSGPQRTLFNRDHQRLLDGAGRQRVQVLTAILQGLLGEQHV